MLQVNIYVDALPGGNVGNTLFMPVNVSIPHLIKKIVEALEVGYAPKTLEEARVQVPSEI